MLQKRVKQNGFLKSANKELSSFFSMTVLAVIVLIFAFGFIFVLRPVIQQRTQLVAQRSSAFEDYSVSNNYPGISLDITEPGNGAALFPEKMEILTAFLNIEESAQLKLDDIGWVTFWLNGLQIGLVYSGGSNYFSKTYTPSCKDSVAGEPYIEIGASAYDVRGNLIAVAAPEKYNISLTGC